MDRTNATNWVDIGGGKRGFRNRDIATGVRGTTHDAVDRNAVQEEIVGAIESSGIVPAAGTLTQLRQHIDRVAGGVATAALNANTTLTADHAGIVNIAITANRTFTLPAANAAGGSPIRIAFVRTDTSAFTATVNRAGANLIEGLTSITIPVGGRVMLVSDGVSAWRVASGIAGTSMQVFAAGGTFVVPGGVYRIKCRVWGGGGGGGGAGPSGGGASGGGGGGYAEGWYDVTPGQSLTVTVGAGGSAGNGTPTNGGTGGSSSVGALLSATGGFGGQAASGGGVGGVVNGGTGAGGTLNIAGNPANSGIVAGGTVLGSAGGGTFCTSLVGSFSASSGNSAGFPGGGGGGAGGVVAQNGAVGAAGLVIIEW